MAKLRILLTTFTVLASLAAPASEPPETRTVLTELDGTRFEHRAVWFASKGERQPAVLMVPNWMGPTDASFEKATRIANEGYVVLMADMYGVDVRPENSQEAGAAAGAVRADRLGLMQPRANMALAALRSLNAPTHPEQIAAIGFCFGGGTVLELGRAGAEIDVIVSFHGDLVSPTLAQAGQTRASVLVLHGADDPFVPDEDVAAFNAAYQPTEVDVSFVSFANTVHSFTDPQAHLPGRAEFDATSSARAFALMRLWFEQAWEKN